MFEDGRFQEIQGCNVGKEAGYRDAKISILLLSVCRQILGPYLKRTTSFLPFHFLFLIDVFIRRMWNSV
jgi:hypothetical protein